MQVTIKFINENGVGLDLDSCEEETHVFVSLNNGNIELTHKVSIEELKHALRKLSCK